MNGVTNTSIGNLFLYGCPSIEQIIVPANGGIQNMLKQSGCKHNQDLANKSFFC
jgi:hypothetical protein